MKNFGELTVNISADVVDIVNDHAHLQVYIDGQPLKELIKVNLFDYSLNSNC